MAIGFFLEEAEFCILLNTFRYVERISFIIPDLVKIVMKSQSRIIQYHLEFEVKPDVQPHSGCVLWHKSGCDCTGKRAPLSNVLDPPLVHHLEASLPHYYLLCCFSHYKTMISLHSSKTSMFYTDQNSGIARAQPSQTLWSMLLYPSLSLLYPGS